MAVLQSIKPLRSETFGSLADRSWDILTKHLNQQGCNCIGIVFDRYDKKDSIKDQARFRRGSSAALEINISGGNTPVPNQWSKFMSNCKNKANLTHFLCERWYDICPQILPAGKSIVLSGGFGDPLRCVKVSSGHVEELQVLYSDHEESDTRMILHAKNAGHNHEMIVIQSTDTDVAVLSIFAFFSLQCQEVWFQTGTKDKFRYIPIHTISQELGPDVCSALPGFHSITGCDSTSVLCGIGKKKGFQLFKSSAAYQQSLQGLGNSLEVSEACRASCEKFFAICTPQLLLQP